MALVAKNTSSASKDLPEVNTHMGRLVGLTELGHQPGFEYNGKQIESQYKIEYTYELPHSLIAANGKPHWVSEEVKVNNYEGKGITSTMMYRFRVLDPQNRGKDGSDLTTQLNGACMVTLSAGTNGYPRMKGQAAVGSIPLGMEVPALVNDTFIWTNPQGNEPGEVDMERFYEFPEFKQDKIKAALDFDTSKLFIELAKAGEI